MNHCRPHGPTIYIGIVSSKYMILSKHVHTDVPAIGMVIVDAPSPVVLQAFVSRWHQAASVCRLAAELKMALPLPAPTESSVYGYASGITTGTLGTYCLPDTDCGLVILRKLGLVGQSEYHTLSFHPSLLEGNPMLEELVATKHPFSFKGKGHGLTYM